MLVLFVEHGILKPGYHSLLQIVGDNNLIMGSCHVAHDCIIGNKNIMANGTLLAGHVVVHVSTFNTSEENVL